MWRDKSSQPGSPSRFYPESTPSTTSNAEVFNPSTIRQPAPNLSNSSQTILGRSIVLHGELSGSGDLLIEGKFDGEISLEDHCLTVSPDAEVKAVIGARSVVVMGSVTGNITAQEKVDIRRTGRVLGDLRTAGIAIEDGAYFKGNIEIARGDGQVLPKKAKVAGASGADK